MSEINNIDNNITKVINKILNAVEILIDSKINKLAFDQTYICTVINKVTVNNTTYSYQVIINGKNYSINSKDNYSIGDKILVKIPCNNWLNIYIEKSI